MKKEIVGLQMMKSEKKLLEKLAKRKGISLSELMRRGAWMYLSLDQHTQDYISGLGKRLGITEDKIISILLTSKVAEDQAWREVHKSLRPIPEFMITAEGPIMGQQLFDIIKNNLVKQFRLQQEGKHGTETV